MMSTRFYLALQPTLHMLCALETHPWRGTGRYMMQERQKEEERGRINSWGQKGHQVPGCTTTTQTPEPSTRPLSKLKDWGRRCRLQGL